MIACRGSTPASDGAREDPEPAAPAREPAAEPEPAPAPIVQAPARVVAPARPTKRVEAALSGIDADALKSDVAVLADDALGGRATPSDGLDRAADHLVARARALGLQPPDGLPEYRQTFDCGRGGQPPASNVVAIAKGDGSTRERVIVSAHYDHLGTRSFGDDRVFNGANDDASGVAGALAVVAAVARLRPAPRRDVVFVAFCGEEIGFVGSRHFVESPPVALDGVLAVFNLEMIGRPEADTRDRVWITGMPFSDLGAITAAAASAEGVRVVDATVIGPEEGAAFDRSDNLPFAHAGVIAHSFSTGRIDELYHHVDDETDALDYAAMAKLVRGIARGVIAVADGDTAPTWTEAGRSAGWGR